MKRKATLTILEVMVIAAAISCTKELNGAVDRVGDTMSLTVSASLPDYADATKSVLVSTVRVKWINGDKVYVYDNAKCLGTLTATVSDEQGKTALLSGEISTSEASKLTLVAMTDDITPSVKEKDEAISGGITFDLSSQSLAGAPYVAYATVPKPSGEVSNISAAFTIATSVERVNCTGLKASTAIDSVIIKGVNTQLTITPNANGAPVVAATTGKGTIIRKSADGFADVSEGGAVTFSVALLKQDAASRRISTVQSNWVNEAKFTNGSTLEKGLSYNTVCQLSSDYVLIKAKYNGTDSTTLKWYKQNLAITASGKKAWKGQNTSAVKVPGYNDEVIVGDYFQWAASYKGYNITVEANKKPENLLIYTAFTNKGCGDSEDKFTFIDSRKFNLDNAPYGGTSYTKYTSSTEPTLEKSDDVANIILGDNWRMPTSAEFKAMADATYWAWDYDDQGHYVFKPGQGTKGVAGGAGAVAASDTTALALLFFPDAGYGGAMDFDLVGGSGFYWSSTLDSSNTDYACFLNVVGPNNISQYNGTRYCGVPVRPVSD